MTNAELDLLIEGRLAASSGRGKRLRESAGLNQSDLARIAGVSPAAVNRWEAGERIPTGVSAVAYARALRTVAERLARV